jgi:hypothetical protein
MKGRRACGGLFLLRPDLAPAANRSYAWRTLRERAFIRNDPIRRSPMELVQRFSVSYFCALLAATVSVSSCGENLQTPVNPDRRDVGTPLYGHSGTGGTFVEGALAPGEFGVSTPGACLGDVAVGQVPDVQLASDLTCTSKDLVQGQAIIRQYETSGVFIDYEPGTLITCSDGQTVGFRIAIPITQAGSGPRTDVGMWIGGIEGAISGSCSHVTLSSGTGDIDGDVCGDMIPGATVMIPLDIGVQCRSDQPGFQHVSTCLAWSQPGQDRNCSEGGFLLGTLPGSKSKCSCAEFDLPLVLAQ